MGRSRWEPISALVSDAARRAEDAAVGSPADAVVWETVQQQTVTLSLQRRVYVRRRSALGATE
jgi:hypothetical protein